VFGGGWSPLSFSTVASVVDGAVSVDPEVSNPATKQLDGATLNELTIMFASAKPDQAADAGATE